MKFDIVLKDLSVTQIARLRLILDKADTRIYTHEEDKDLDVLIEKLGLAVSNLKLV